MGNTGNTKNMKKRKWFELSSANLHIIAMLLMLCDHLWANFFLSERWMTSVGRIAFPIFAFMIAEGFFRTSNRWKYIRRMAIFAFISEIPFNLGVEHALIYPYHQNVLFTFLLGMFAMMLIEKVRTGLQRKLSKQILSVIFTIMIAILITLVFFLLGMITFVDYYGFGVAAVIVFYLSHTQNLENLFGGLVKEDFRSTKAYGVIIQLISMVLQVVLLYQIFDGLGGYYFTVNIFGFEVEVVEELLALFALPIIWLYRGKKGYSAKWFQYFNYAFYPAHLFIIYLVTLVVSHFS